LIVNLNEFRSFLCKIQGKSELYSALSAQRWNLIVFVHDGNLYRQRNSINCLQGEWNTSGFTGNVISIDYSGHSLDYREKRNLLIEKMYFDPFRVALPRKNRIVSLTQ